MVASLDERDIAWRDTNDPEVARQQRATAATVVPAMAEKAAHVTMLQRTPTFIAAVPKTHELAIQLRALDIPEEWTHEILRRAYIEQFNELTRMCQETPEEARQFLLGEMRPLLPEGYEVEKHFNPGYRPWQQRIAVVPDGDIFTAISEGRASVVTDTIDTFTETGIRLASGAELDADIVVAATGLSLLAAGGMALTVDGAPVSMAEAVTYKGMMLSGVPNFALAIGYTNASWTLKVDLVSEYVCRLLTEMDRTGSTVVTPVPPPPGPREPLLNLQANYIKRGLDALPRQARTRPWRLNQNYPRDVLLFRHGPVTDAVEFR